MKTIIRLDSTALAKSSCMLRLHLFAGEGLTFMAPKPEIEFGVAFHKGMEAFELHWTDDLPMRTFYAVQAAGTHWARMCDAEPKMVIPKGKEHYCQDMLNLVVQRYISSVASCDRSVETVRMADGKPCIEEKFAIPFYTDDDYEVLLCGTVDRIVRIRSSGMMAIWDYKTTSSRTPDTYLSNFALSGQLRIYQYAAMWMANNFPDGVFGQAMRFGRMGAFIEGVFLNADITKVEAQRSNCFFSDATSLSPFIRNMQACVARYVYHLRNGDIAEQQDGILNGSCESYKFGRCDYWGVCVLAGQAQAQEMYKRNFFRTKVYDPLNFHD